MFQFTNTWFVDGAKTVWDHLIPQLNPTRILEVGSFEGASACYLIENLGSNKNIEIHCIDTWDGSLEHQDGGLEETSMTEVEKRFLHNISTAQAIIKNRCKVHIHKGLSHLKLSQLLLSGFENYFDLIYIDGSHQAPDVMCDAVLSFKLLRTEGILVFDDYLWSEPLPYGVDPVRSPKLAIDAFTNIYCRKISILRLPLHQLSLQKKSD